MGLILLFVEFFKSLVRWQLSNWCTNKSIILVRILINMLFASYFSIGQWIAGKTVELIELHLSASPVGSKDSHVFNINKFTGMDLEFLVNQVMYVRLVVLVTQVVSLMDVLEKLLNFFGVVHNYTQDCRLFQSLIDGSNLKFWRNQSDINLYGPDLFISIQLVTSYLQRFLKVILPMGITLVVFHQIQRAESSKKIDLGFDSSSNKRSI